MTTKRVDLKAFVGKDFDMEFYVGLDCGPIGEWSRSVWSINKLDKIDSSDEVIYSDNNLAQQTYICRPRLNKEQVLLDYSWLPDGIVWECRTGYGDNPIWSSEEVKENAKYGYIQWISAIGLHPDYAEQAKEWGYPVVEL